MELKTYDSLKLRTRNLLLPGMQINHAFFKQGLEYLEMYYKIKTDFCSLDGLHPRAISQNIDQYGDKTPFILATFNSYVVDCFGYSIDEDPTDAFIFVDTEVIKGDTKDSIHFKYYQLSDKDERDVRLAYKQGIEYMSGILLARGLW